MIAEATLTSKGQLTLPKAVREALGLREGDKVLFTIRGERVELEAVTGSILDWYGTLRAEGPQDLKAVAHEAHRLRAEEVALEGSSKGRR